MFLSVSAVPVCRPVLPMVKLTDRPAAIYMSITDQEQERETGKSDVTNSSWFYRVLTSHCYWLGIHATA